MSDLISRKAVVEAFNNYFDDNYFLDDRTEIMKQVVNIVENVPTAFDKEKVIKKLQENAEDAREYWQKYSCDDMHGLFRGYKNAIDIVEKGGIDEKNKCICCGEIIPEGQQVCKSCIEDSRKSKEPEWKKKLLAAFLRRRQQDEQRRL